LLKHNVLTGKGDVGVSFVGLMWQITLLRALCYISTIQIV